jgi:hypothetical protein
MKKFFFAAAIAAMTMTACSNDPVANKTNENGDPVAFNALTDKGTTRAAVANRDNMTGFTVTGWWNYDEAGNDYGDATKGAYLFDAFDISRGEAGTTLFDYNPKRYWPTSGSVDFFAYSPASSINVNAGLKGLSTTKKAITYTVPIVSENNPQEDFLVATALDKANGTVTLNFQHALSRVKFQARKNVKDVEYLIGGVSLVGLNSKGELDVTAVDGSNASVFPEAAPFTYSATPLVLWTEQSAPIANVVDDITSGYAVDFSKAPVSVEYDATAAPDPFKYTSIIGETNALMVMPQATTLGEVYQKADADATLENLRTPKAGAETAFYVKVSYKAVQAGNIYLAGSADAYREMYLPVAIDNAGTPEALTFEIGRQYTFNLTFGTGSDLGDAIIFNVDVEGWSEVEVAL